VLHGRERFWNRLKTATSALRRCMVAHQCTELHCLELELPLKSAIIDPQAKLPSEIRVSPEDPAEVARLRAEGLSFRKIAKQLDISVGIVERRFQTTSKPDPVARRTHLDVQDIVKLRRKGTKFTQIGKRLRVSQTTIYERVANLTQASWGTLSNGQIVILK